MVSFEVSKSYASPPTTKGILRDHLKIQVKPKIWGNTVDIFLASVEFGDGPFAKCKHVQDSSIFGESITAKKEILERDI
jgi:hypothetical protein